VRGHRGPRPEHGSRVNARVVSGAPLRPAFLLLTVLVAACSRGTQAPASRPATTPDPNVAQLGIRPQGDRTAIEFLIAEGTQRSHVPEDLRYLTDVIGPRLTGSAAVRRANEWTAGKFREYGADSVRLEPWRFGVAWQRGPLTMRLVSPHERSIEAASWAWAPGTNGPRAGDVVFVDATTRADFDRRFAGRIKGAWVMLSAPYPRTNPFYPDARDSARVDSLRRAMRRDHTAEERSFLQGRTTLLAGQGIAGEIVDGAKDYGLFTMSGGPDDIEPFPRVVIGNQQYAELHRALARAQPVRVEVNAVNTFGRDTLMQWNTVAEIRGAELPDEIVLLGAHLDSWDLGTGTTDNAAGSIAVLEAARLLGALKATGVRPKRSIRFALFTGEEQGLYGSQYYVLGHVPEMSRMQAVLVLDNGTGRIGGMALQGWNELHELWTAMFRPLAALGPFVVRSGNKGGTDHLPFLEARVPSFNYDQPGRGYDYTHHSQIDVFDYAVPDDVKQAATVMAVNALQLANLDRLLPRRRP
jgi:carboxypeptidase Q